MMATYQQPEMDATKCDQLTTYRTLDTRKDNRHAPEKRISAFLWSDDLPPDSLGVVRITLFQTCDNRECLCLTA